LSAVTAHNDKFIFRRSIVIATGFVFLLWFIRALEDSMTLDLGVWGILPRSVTGLVGIVTAPLIHGSAFHLLSNTFPLIMLLVAVFYFYDKIAAEVFIWIYITTGFWVWVVARQAYHIGSSGLVYGLAAFLFFSGIFRKDARSVAVAVVIAFIHGGMLQGLFPTESSVSWESHLLGSAAGIFCSFYFRKVPTVEKPEEENAEVKDNISRMSNTSSGCGFSDTDVTYTFKATEKKEQNLLYYDVEAKKSSRDLLL
jgi:membrane associated rhomboid family serine protease